MNKKPNIIIVMTDQQRQDLRKSRGYYLDTMPFLDQWAEGGVDFCNAYTSNPTCMPARVSMYTGRYTSSHKVRTNHNEEDAIYTKDLLDVLKENGYTTALCGKNHSHHKREDFDFVAETGHLGNEGEINETPDEKEFAEFLLNTNHMETHQPSPGGVEVQHPYRNVSSCFQFIDGLEKKEPFFVWLSFAEPHNPYQVPEPYFNMFPPESLPEITGAEELEKKGPRFRWLRGVWEQVLGDEIDQRVLRCRSNYLGMLRLIDDQFKRLVTGLKERDLEDDTIVIYLSDHGDFGGEYGLIRKGVDLPDVLTHIPMVWKGPKIAAVGKQDQNFVSIVDILPTLCKIIGAEVPYGCQGKNILPLLKNKDIPEKEFVTAYSESGFGGRYWNEEDALTLSEEGASDPEITRFDCLNTWTQCGAVRMIRKGSFKLQEDMMGKGCLYDLTEDPMELNNLWDQEEYASVKEDMLQELVAAMLKQEDVIPAPHRRYRVKTNPDGYWFDNAHTGDTGIRKDELLCKCCNHQSR